MADERVARLVIPHDRLFVAAAALIAGWLLIACAGVGRGYDVGIGQVAA